MKCIDYLHVYEYTIRTQIISLKHYFIQQVLSISTPIMFTLYHFSKSILETSIFTTLEKSGGRHFAEFGLKRGKFDMSLISLLSHNNDSLPFRTTILVSLPHKRINLYFLTTALPSFSPQPIYLLLSNNGISLITLTTSLVSHFPQSHKSPHSQNSMSSPIPTII